MQTFQNTTATPLAFNLGDPVSSLDRADILNYFESVLIYDRYYLPPVDFSALARAVKSSAHHQSAINVKTNILLSTAITSPLLPPVELERLIQDFIIFGNAYLELQRDYYGKPKRLKARLAKYIRKGTKEGEFYQINGAEEYQFKNFSVFHLFKPDFNQEVYGMPDYLGALHSALLNEAATLFRRKYYLNGAHAGSIIYITDPNHKAEDIEEIKRQLQQTKGKGNFKNLFIYSPDGKKDGIQLLPLSDVIAKDEFLNMKNTSRDDVLAAHRVPPQLMGIIPNNTGGFGDVEKAGRVFFINEIKPLQQRLKAINDWVGQEVIRFDEYELLKN